MLFRSRSVDEIKHDIQQSGENQQTYTIKYGDTLSSIAEALGIDVHVLANLNNISNMDLIYPGTVLKTTVNDQKEVTSDVDRYGSALSEIEKQVGNIQSEFSQFVTLNSSGDPVEAAEILDTAESHIVALTHIVERVPEIVSALQAKLPDQLEDLESGYRKLLESGYHFTETYIESRFQQLHASLKNNMANVSALELDNAIYENEQIQEEIDALYHIFTRESSRSP